MKKCPSCPAEIPDTAVACQSCRMVAFTDMTTSPRFHC